MQDHDQKLITLLHNQNEEAIALLIQQYGGLIKSIIRKQLTVEDQDFEECLDERYLFAFICGEDDLNNSEILLLTESEVIECIQTTDESSKWLTIEMANRKRTLTIRGNAHTKGTPSLRIPRSADQRLEDLPTMLF